MIKITAFYLLCAIGIYLLLGLPYTLYIIIKHRSGNFWDDLLETVACSCLFLPGWPLLMWEGWQMRKGAKGVGAE